MKNQFLLLTFLIGGIYSLAYCPKPKPHACRKRPLCRDERLVDLAHGQSALPKALGLLAFCSINGIENPCPINWENIKSSIASAGTIRSNMSALSVRDRKKLKHLIAEELQDHKYDLRMLKELAETVAKEEPHDNNGTAGDSERS